MAVNPLTGCSCKFVHFSILSKTGKQTKACTQESVAKHVCFATDPLKVTCSRCMGTVPYVRAYYHLTIYTET
jgi:hypothetical protein